LQIAVAHRLPLVRIHHMEAHALVSRLPCVQKTAAGGPGAGVEKPDQTPLVPAFPFVTLLVSGGHNMAVLTRGVGRHTILGSTLDDSIGEAFDKTARLLNIQQVPGGPHLEKLAKEGDAMVHRNAVTLPCSNPNTKVSPLDYSFSGLKTSIRTLIEKELPSSQVADLPEEEVRRKRADFAAVFQDTAVHHLVDRVSGALQVAKEMEPSVKSLVVAGGVAANQQVRSRLEEVAECAAFQMHCPPPRLCVDNGVMVAWAGIERLRLGLYENPPSEAECGIELRPRWPLGERAIPRGSKKRKRSVC